MMCLSFYSLTGTLLVIKMIFLDCVICLSSSGPWINPPNKRSIYASKSSRPPKLCASAWPTTETNHLAMASMKKNCSHQMPLDDAMWVTFPVVDSSILAPDPPDLQELRSALKCVEGGVTY